VRIHAVVELIDQGVRHAGSPAPSMDTIGRIVGDIRQMGVVMTFVNGELQARFMGRIRGLDPQRCLVVPVDVGKTSAVALVADHYGEILVPPFEFALTETGFAALVAAVGGAWVERDAEIVRIGVEAAGHYHRTLVARLVWRSLSSTRER
jgi:Transposase